MASCYLFVQNISLLTFPFNDQIIAGQKFREYSKLDLASALYVKGTLTDLYVHEFYKPYFMRDILASTYYNQIKSDAEEEERKRREKEEAEQKQREKEEEERKKREKEEAERQQREREEAERQQKLLRWKNFEGQYSSYSNDEQSVYQQVRISLNGSTLSCLTLSQGYSRNSDNCIPANQVSWNMEIKNPDSNVLEGSHYCYPSMQWRTARLTIQSDRQLLLDNYGGRFTYKR